MAETKFLTLKDQQEILSECTNKDKFLLVCSRHGRAYGQKRPPVAGCKECYMVDFLGLMANTPPNKRLEIMEMLEYSVRSLIQAENDGILTKQSFYKHPRVSIEKDAI